MSSLRSPANNVSNSVHYLARLFWSLQGSIVDRKSSSERPQTDNNVRADTCFIPSCVTLMKIYITADPGCSCKVVQKAQGEIPNPPLAPPQIPGLSPAKLCSLTLAKPKSQVLPYRNCKSYICQYLPYQTNCLHDLQLALCSRMHTLCLGYLASASRPSGHVSYGKWACDLDLT